MIILLRIIVVHIFLVASGFMFSEKSSFFGITFESYLLQFLLYPLSLIFR